MDSIVELFIGVATGGSKLIDPLYAPSVMARRRSKNRTRSLQPAVMRINYRIPANATAVYADLFQSLSQVNRRFMRQGYNLAIANVRITTLAAALPTAPTTAYVNTLPHTWATANSWMKSFSLWKKQQDEALENSDSEETAARFRDFKIYADLDHVAAGTAANLQPWTLGPGVTGVLSAGLITTSNALPSEEWMHSEIVVPNDGAPGNTLQYSLHMVGGDIGAPTYSKGMIQGYADSRSTPQSPDPVGPTISASWMQEMFDVGNDNLLVTNNAQDRNNELPYDQDDYPGGDTNMVELECQGYVNNMSTVGVTTFNTGPFTAPCGLLRFDFNGQTTEHTAGAYNIVTVELVPGNHRGYLAETMEEF